MNNRDRPLFPWSSYVPGPHSSLTSAQRFPYDVSGSPSSSHAYHHGTSVHSPLQYLGRHSSPASAFRTSPPPMGPVGRLEYSPSPDRFSSRYSASSPRRRFPDDERAPLSDSVVVNAGFSFLMGKENSIIHKHVDVQPAHAIPEAPSSGLTRQIDKFLKKSDHTLDRYQNIVQSRSRGRVSGLGQRGKSMTPAGGRDESPEPSSIGLSAYRSQRSTSAASIAVKAEKHLESLKSEDKARKAATAPIAEHEEDQLDDDLSTTDSSLDGFDTDDDVPRSTDVFDISDDTSADLSKLDDMSSDSDDEYFDVVQLPGLRPPNTSSTHTPSTSPAPDQQQQKNTDGNVTQEPALARPAHSRSMPAVNKGLVPVKMGNVQTQSPSTNQGTDTKQSVTTAQHSTPRNSEDTSNLANAINIRAPFSPTREINPKVQTTIKAENIRKEEYKSGKEAGKITSGPESLNRPPYSSKTEGPNSSNNPPTDKLVKTSDTPRKESVVETSKVTNGDITKVKNNTQMLSHNEVNTMKTVNHSEPNSVKKLDNRESAIAQKNDKVSKNSSPPKGENTPNENFGGKSLTENITKLVGEDLPPVHNTQITNQLEKPKPKVLDEIAKGIEIPPTPPSKKKLEVLAKVETLKAKIAEIESKDLENEQMMVREQNDSSKRLPSLDVKENNQIENKSKDAVSYEDKKNFGQKSVGTPVTKNLGRSKGNVKSKNTQEIPASSLLNNNQELSVKPKYGKVLSSELQSSAHENTSSKNLDVKEKELDTINSKEPTVKELNAPVSNELAAKELNALVSKNPVEKGLNAQVSKEQKEKELKAQVSKEDTEKKVNGQVSKEPTKKELDVPVSKEHTEKNLKPPTSKETTEKKLNDQVSKGSTEKKLDIQVSKEPTEKGLNAPISKESTEKKLDDQVSKEPTKKRNAQVSKDPTEKGLNASVSKEPTEKKLDALVSKVPVENGLSDPGSKKPTEKGLSPPVSKELTKTKLNAQVAKEPTEKEINPPVSKELTSELKKTEKGSNIDKNIKENSKNLNTSSSVTLPSLLNKPQKAVEGTGNQSLSDNKPSVGTLVSDIPEASISRTPVAVTVSVCETLPTQSIPSEATDKIKITPSESPASSKVESVDSGIVSSNSLDHENSALRLKGKQVGPSLNEEKTNTTMAPGKTNENTITEQSKETSGNKGKAGTSQSAVTPNKIKEKPPGKQPADSTSQAMPTEQKVNQESTVPAENTIPVSNETAPPSIGQLQSTPNSGPGPPKSGKESAGNSNKESMSRPDVKGSETKPDLNTLSAVEKQSSKIKTGENDGKVSKDVSSKSGAEISATKNTNECIPNNEEKNIVKNAPVNGDEAMDSKILNGVLENGIFEGSDDKDDFENDFSEIETFVDLSRCSSVCSDTSRTMSPDVSVRSGIKRPKSEKLSAMMNLWENEDVSQASEKSKVKRPPSKPKVGKISGIKNMFETGKVAEKPEVLNNPNLVKLRSASGAALADPKSASAPAKVAPGASGIASMNAAKFGGTSKFKKPSECSPSAGDKILKREKSNLTKNDLKRNDSCQKVASTVPNDDQKDVVNASSKVNENKDSVMNSNNQKDTESVTSSSNDKDHAIVTRSDNKEKNLEKDCLEKKADADNKEKSAQGTTKEVNKVESTNKVEKDIIAIGSKVVEAKESDVKNSKDVSGKIEGKSNNEVPPATDTSSQSGESGKIDIKKKKKKKKEKDAEEKDKLQGDTGANKVGGLKDSVEVKVTSTKDEESKSESGSNSSNDSKAKDISKDSIKTGVGKDDIGKDITTDQGSSSSDEQKVEINNVESKSKGGKKLGGIKSFIIESVAKGGKTLEDKLSKTGIPLGKKSAKTDNQKGSPTLDSKNKKKPSAIDIKVSANVSPTLADNANVKLEDNMNKNKLEYKQSIVNYNSALESDVQALIKEASDLVEPKKASDLVEPKKASDLVEPKPRSHSPRFTYPKLTLPLRPLESVASFPDTTFGGEFCVTSLPASPTEEKKRFEYGDKHKILSLPASPTKEVHFSFEDSPEEEEVFVDAIDPAQLDTLMPLPDVQSERDIRSRSRTPMDFRERSITPSPVIAESEVILSETDRLLRRSRSNKSLRRSYSRSLSSATLNRLSEVTADLSEEHTTAHLAGERLEAEQAERMKLEKEIDRLQTDVKRMTTANGKLEMEKLALRSEVLSAVELNGDVDDDEAADASLYKRKYEWCLREIELLKKQSKQQQEDDLDQLLLLKKQLEKKVADAYEETDEQRQVVAQLKRKCQRLQAEMNDLKILLEEQTSRNNLLEKKQRKFDQEVMSVQEELRHERTNKDKIQRERDQILSEKYSFEQEVTTLKLELELKEEKVAALNRELDDLTSSGKVEEEVAHLKKAKHDLELRIKDQEEELDDLAGQVQMLEGAKVRLEMSMEQMRKENRREISQREEELEEIRLSAQKKVKSLEAQLENEHEERTLLVREKHELERRITDLQERTITHVDEDYVHKLKKELKKTKALLRDTQTMLEKAQSEGSHKLILRQLKTQLEDAEFAKTAALKARQCAESDLADVSSQLDEALRAKKESEDKCARINKERAEIQTQLEEGEEELAEVMKKYKAVVSQLSVDQITLSEQSQQIAELEHSKQVLQERMMELSSKVEVLEGETANIHTQRRLEMKIKEIESKLELELTTRQRLESQIGRLKDQIERLSGECDAAKLKESQALDQSKRLGRQLRDAKEDLSNIQQRHTEAVNKKSELEKQLELSDAEVVTLKSDLKLAFKRIEDLQQAIQGDISDSDSELSDSDSDSDGSLSSYLTASLKQQRSSSNSTLRTPPSEVQQLERLELPNSPCSEAMSAISEDLDDTSNKESFA